MFFFRSYLIPHVPVSISLYSLPGFLCLRRSKLDHKSINRPTDRVAFYSVPFVSIRFGSLLSSQLRFVLVSSVWASFCPVLLCVVPFRSVGLSFCYL